MRNLDPFRAPFEALWGAFWEPPRARKVHGTQYRVIAETYKKPRFFDDFWLFGRAKSKRNRHISHLNVNIRFEEEKHANLDRFGPQLGPPDGSRIGSKRGQNRSRISARIRSRFKAQLGPNLGPNLACYPPPPAVDLHVAASPPPHPPTPS